jgi:hypothetical protein
MQWQGAWAIFATQGTGAGNGCLKGQQPSAIGQQLVASGQQPVASSTPPSSQ